MSKPEPSADSSRVFEQAAQLFAVLSTPMRLRILSALCLKEKSVSELLQEIATTQPNLSQHLAVLFKSGVVGKRSEGTRVIYSVRNENAVALCRSVCTQVAIELGEPEELEELEAPQVQAEEQAVVEDAS